MDNSPAFAVLTRVVRAYLVVVAATVVTLAVVSVAAPHEATTDAWVHALIVAAVAVLLPLRLRAARNGRRSGLRAVGIISAALLLANVLGVVIPGLYPTWMRIEMVAIAALMAVAVLSVVRIALMYPRGEPVAPADRAGWGDARST